MPRRKHECVVVPFMFHHIVPLSWYHGGVQTFNLFIVLRVVLCTCYHLNALVHAECGKECESKLQYNIRQYIWRYSEAGLPMFLEYIAYSFRCRFCRQTTVSYLRVVVQCYDGVGTSHLVLVSGSSISMAIKSRGPPEEIVLTSFLLYYFGDYVCTTSTWIMYLRYHFP